MAPPIDLHLFRADQCGNIELLKKSQRRRFEDESVIDQVAEVDTICREKVRELDHFRHKTREIGNTIKESRKAGGNPVELQKELKDMKKSIKEGSEELKDKLANREKLINGIGNIVHDDVPVSNDEEDNKIIKTWGEDKKEERNLEEAKFHHHELLYKIGGYEPDRGAKIAGHRGYFLTGPGVEFNLALQRYGLDFAGKYQYKWVQPPLFMKHEYMKLTCQLSEFEEELYGVEDNTKSKEDQKYLIATAEQPISAMHQGEWLSTDSLPIRYAGLSTCFRREAGAHGKDAWGIYRVHQFDKVEQFVFSSPDESWKIHEEMLTISEEFYKSLEIPFRVVSIVSGALNNAAAKKYDLEGWFPTLKRYNELVSCSNCTDYQSRAMETRYGQTSTKKEGTFNKKVYVHMLNSTLCATTRTICCILENYQTPDGIKIPTVLQPYCNGKTFFPFVREAKFNKASAPSNKESKSERNKGGAKGN